MIPQDITKISEAGKSLPGKKKQAASVTEAACWEMLGS